LLRRHSAKTEEGQLPVITVTNASNIVNGDVSSDAALVANGGADGISLPEAIMAANNTPQPTTIVFSSALSGQTIVAGPQGLPSVTGAGLTIMGLVNADGSPAITIAAAPNPTSTLLFVSASNFTLAHLAFAHLGSAMGLVIQASPAGGPTQSISGINVTDNTFSNTGTPAAQSNLAIIVNISDDAHNETISSVTISNNAFTDFTGNDDGILVSTRGTDNAIKAVTISGNTFRNVTYGVELASSSTTNSTIDGTQIVGNSFSGSTFAVALNQVGNPGTTTGSVISSTLIANNLISDCRIAGVDFYAVQASNNATTDTSIVNNVFDNDNIAININGGTDKAVGNTVRGVNIVNDTIIDSSSPSIYLNPNQNTTGNTISGVTVENTLFFGNSVDVSAPTPISVSHSLTSLFGYAGTNGNVSGDPLFVNAAGDDFHLKAGSPAIGAGDPVVAPIVDLNLGGRFSGAGGLTAVDIGAYAFSPGPTPLDAPQALIAGISAVLRAKPGSAAYDGVEQPIAAALVAGSTAVTDAVGQLVVAARNTTSVATMAYEFFTSQAPSAVGMDYLVSPTGPNPNNLNSGYYQTFNVINRYINFAVNLGKVGAGEAWFQTNYGSLSLSDATAKAYGVIFGTTPTAAKVDSLLTPVVETLNGQNLTRADYFATYGGDGPNGLGTKAAMVGWILGEAVVSDLGSYAKSNDAFLTDVALHNAPFGVDVIGHYAQPGFAYTGW